jgi:hypothetical protein
LLTVCFTRPQDDVFRERRYWKEPPAHRWCMRNAGGDLIAHVAAHNKRFTVCDERAGTDVAGEELRVAGIAEVCVHPAARGMGHVGEMLGVAHSALERMGFQFAALFGNPRVYRSSDYRISGDPVRFLDDGDNTWKTMRFDGRENGAFMWRPLLREDWPQGTIDLRGPKF